MFGRAPPPAWHCEADWMGLRPYEAASITSLLTPAMWVFFAATTLRLIVMPAVLRPLAHLCVGRGASDKDVPSQGLEIWSLLAL